MAPAKRGVAGAVAGMGLTAGPRPGAGQGGIPIQTAVQIKTLVQYCGAAGSVYYGYRRVGAASPGQPPPAPATGRAGCLATR
jgi:hypothetical protein